MSRRIVSPSKEELIELYSKEGATISSVARHYKTSTPTVRKWLIDYGIERKNHLLSCIEANRRTKKNKKGKEDQDSIYNWNKDQFKIDFLNLNNEEIIKKYNISHTTLYKWANQLKLERPKNNYIVDKDLLYRLYYLEEKSFNELQDVFNMSNVTLKKRYVELGLPLRSHSQTQKITSKKCAITKLEKHGYEYFPTGIPYGSKSKNEIEIGNYLNSFGFNFKTDSTILDGKHIDLYDDQLKIGIEYSGTWCHHENIDRIYKNYHYDKWANAKNKGVQLITIWDYEYINNKEKILNYLKSKCGIFDKRIYARDCIFKELTNKNYRFFENNHIQGKPNNIYRNFGLFYEDRLVACVSYYNHHRNSNEMVLNRLAFESNLQIIGGASKILKNSLNLMNMSIITWSDNRWSTGEIYRKAGFKLDKNLNPDYFYTLTSSVGMIRSKQSMTKKKLNCPPEKTEKEYCLELGWNRVWDCGKIRWVWENKMGA
jgi:transposase-like protein